MKSATRAWLVEASNRTEGLSGVRPLARDILDSDAKKDEKIRKLEKRVKELAAEPNLRTKEAKQFHENYCHMQYMMVDEMDKMRDRILGAVASASMRCTEQESGGHYCSLPKGHAGGHYVKVLE